MKTEKLDTLTELSFRVMFSMASYCILTIPMIKHNLF